MRTKQNGRIAHSRASRLGPPMLMAALAGCAAHPAMEGGAASFTPQQAAQRLGPDWVLLGNTEEGALYMHPRSTLRVGSSAFIMVVASKHQPVVLPGGTQVGSVRERYEVDCVRQRYRRHDGTAHPDHAGLGPVLGQIGQQQWKDVRPGTVLAAVSAFVCSAAAPDASREPAAPPLLRTRRGTFST